MDKVEVKFVYYFLQTMQLSQYDVGASNPTLNRNHIHLLRVTVPDPPIQRCIAAILSAYDDLIENNTQRIRDLEAMAQMLYREWFVQFRYPGHESVPLVESDLGPIPRGWEVVPFTDIADVLSGGTPKTKVPEYWNGGIPFFSPKDAGDSFYVLETEREISDLGLAKCNSDLYPQDTVFITARGTVGKVLLPGVPMAMNQSCYALVGRDGFTQYFVFLCVQEAVNQLQQQAHGAVFDTIIVDTFRRLLVLRPQLPLIADFQDMISPVFNQLLVLMQKNALLRETRDLLLPRLVSGELDVSALEIETGELDV